MPNVARSVSGVSDLTGNRKSKELNTNPAFNVSGNPTDTVADKRVTNLYGANGRLTSESNKQRETGPV